MSEFYNVQLGPSGTIIISAYAIFLLVYVYSAHLRSATAPLEALGNVALENATNHTTAVLVEDQLQPALYLVTVSWE